MLAVLKKTIRILKYALLSLFFFILLLVGLINLPFAHKIITNKVNRVFHEKGLPVHIGKLSLILNGKIELNRIEIHSMSGDTIIYAGSVNISVSPFPLFSNRIVIRNMELADIVVNLQTDKNTGKLTLLSLFPPSTEPEKEETKSINPWEIEVNQIHLNEIRFLYHDSLNGILVKQILHKADITFDTFSLLKKQVDIGNLVIEKANGQLSVSKGNNDSVQTVTPPAEWKFSARHLDLNDVVYELNQPGSKQKTLASLKHADITVKNLDLAKSEVNIMQIKLVDPNVLIEISGSTSTQPKVKEPVKKDSAEKLWSFMCGLIKIENGSFIYNNINEEQKNDFAQWMPVEKFNTTINDVKYNSKGSAFSINELSFDLNNKVFLKSGEIVLVADDSMNYKVSSQLIASLNMEQQKLLSKSDEVKLSTSFSGSPDVLQIEKCVISSTCGIDLSVSGYVTELIEFPHSHGKLEFKTGMISYVQTNELIALSGTQVKLPHFEPISYSGFIANSILKPEFKVSMQSYSGNIVLNGNYDIKNKNGQMDATFSQIKLRKVFGNSYPESITCNAKLSGGVDNKNLISGKGNILINSALYNGVEYENINLDLSVINNSCQFTLLSKDTNFTCNLNGLFDWNYKSYNGKLSGDFNLNQSNTSMLPGQLAFQGEIESAFQINGKNLQSKVDLKNLSISNLANMSHLDSLSCSLNFTDNLVSTQIKTDFLEVDFESQSSLDEMNKAIKSVRFENAPVLDSTLFLKLDAVNAFPVFNFTGIVKYHSVFQLFYPDSVLNFDTLKIAIDKKVDENVIHGEISESAFKYLNYISYGLKLQARFDEQKWNCNLAIDSINVNDMSLGLSTFTLDAIPEHLLGTFSVSGRDSMPLYQLGVEAVRENNKLTLKSTEADWVINSNTWSLSPSEFLTRESISSGIITDLHLQNDDRKIELVGRESESLKLGLKNVRISSLLSPQLIKNLPDGTINADVVYSGGDQKNIDFKFDIAEFKWQDMFLNSINASGKVVSDTSGIIEANLTATLDDSSTFTINSSPGNNLTAKNFHSTFKRVPLKLLGPLLTDYVDQLKGETSGEISLGMENKQPKIDGEIRLQHISLFAIPLKTWFSIADDKLVIEKNHLNFNQFTVLDSMQKPLHISGTINLENIDSIITDLNIKSDNLQIMNTSVKDDPRFFGSIVINSGLNISGPISNPSVKGSVALESGTNITYRYMEDLSVKETERTVTFAKFSGDSLEISPKSKLSEFSGVPFIQTTIEINPKSVFNVQFSSGFAINVKVSGKGLLNYSMLPNNTISLSGSYEITEGTSDLKFTGWPLKNFSITPGSSFQWDGKFDDPRLNLEATSKVKGSYLNPIDNKNRTVDFIVSMKLADQLSQLKIIFDVKSNDQYISSVFGSLSADEVMRQAINLLIFESVDLPGMESSTSYMSAQINSFWESQLNSLTKTSFKKVDISFGLDTYKQTSSSGAEEEKTSLSYAMERKLFKDRASVKVSGRLSDDNNQNSKESSNLIENFSFEYALDTLDKRYLKIYRKQDYEDVIEGEVIKYGVGFIFRRSYHHLSDIWKRKPKKQINTVPSSGKAN